MAQSARIYFSQMDNLPDRLVRFEIACRNEKPKLTKSDIDNAFSSMIGFDTMDEAFEAVSTNVSHIADCRLKGDMLTTRHSHFLRVLASLGLSEVATKRVLDIASPTDGNPFDRYGWLLDSASVPSCLRSLRDALGELAGTPGVKKYASLCAAATRDDPYWDERQSIKFYGGKQGHFRGLMSAIRKHAEHPALIITCLKFIEAELTSSERKPRYVIFSNPGPCLKAMRIGDISGISDALMALPDGELLRVVNIFRQEAGRCIAESGAGRMFPIPTQSATWSTSTEPWQPTGGNLNLRSGPSPTSLQSPWSYIGCSEDISVFCFHAFNEGIKGNFWIAKADCVSKEISRSIIDAGVEIHPHSQRVDDRGRETTGGMLAIGWSANKYSRKAVIGLIEVSHSVTKGDCVDDPSHTISVDIMQLSPRKEDEALYAFNTFIATEMQNIVKKWDRVLRPGSRLLINVECRDDHLCMLLDDTLRYALDNSEDGGGMDMVCIDVDIYVVG